MAYVGLDVGLETIAAAVTSEKGDVLREVTLPANLDALSAFLSKLPEGTLSIGLESGSFGQWVGDAVEAAGHVPIVLEARRAHAVLKTRLNRSDRSDALGIARLLRTGDNTIVHRKSLQSRDTRALLAARRITQTAAGRATRAARCLLRDRGLLLAPVPDSKFAAAALTAAVVQAPGLVTPISHLLATREAALGRFRSLDRMIAEIAAEDPVCQLLMTIPGVGVITALSFRTSIDDPSRFSSSKSVGPYFGLTHSSKQSGKGKRVGEISCKGDRHTRASLYLSATVIMMRKTAPNWLQDWGQRLKARKSGKVAYVGLARKLAVTMHRMWVLGLDFEAFSDIYRSGRSHGNSIGQDPTVLRA